MASVHENSPILSTRIRLLYLLEFFHPFLTKSFICCNMYIHIFELRLVYAKWTLAATAFHIFEYSSLCKLQNLQNTVYFSSENRYIQAFCTSLLKIVAFACEKISIQVKKKYVSKKFKVVNIVISSRFL